MGVQDHDDCDDDDKIITELSNFMFKICTYERNECRPGRVKFTLIVRALKCAYFNANREALIAKFKRDIASASGVSADQVSVNVTGCPVVDLQSQLIEMSFASSDDQIQLDFE